MHRRYAISERPLSPQDYDVPVGWWGWNWDPPVPLSVVELLEARNMDARTAALCWLVLERHGSLLIAAEQPHSGKTTTLTAFLDFVPSQTRRVFIRGWSETFDYLRHAQPKRTLLLANELSSHLPVYLWGPKAVRVFASLRKGYALGSTMHADAVDGALSHLVGELGVSPQDVALVDLLMVMRITQSLTGAVARRVVTLHRLGATDGVPLAATPLVEWDPARDEHLHHEAAQLALLAARGAGEGAAARAELERRAEFLLALCGRRVRDIPRVRAAIAGFRGERVRSNGGAGPA